jgi:hypothetical protein
VRVSRLLGAAAAVVARKPGLLDTSPGVPFAVGSSVHLEVAIGEGLSAVKTPEAADMVLDLELILEVLSLDALLAAAAEAAVQLVVVLLAVGLIVEHVELSRAEGLCARCADEAGLVVFSGQPSICGRDALARDGLPAGFAVAPVRGSLSRALSGGS